MTFQLLMHHPKANEARLLVARHVDPNWLKQRGYEMARSLGGHCALWRCTDEGSPIRQFALEIDSEARLTIERASQATPTRT